MGSSPLGVTYILQLIVNMEAFTERTLGYTELGTSKKTHVFINLILDRNSEEGQLKSCKILMVQQKTCKLQIF